MAILPDFIVKHIRPYGLEAIEALSDRNAGLAGWMENDLQLDAATVRTLIEAWAHAGMLAINPGTLPSFAAAADNVAKARWAALYSNDKSRSTVLFADNDALADISEAAQHNPATPPTTMKRFHVTIARGAIPLGVTIFKDGSPPEFFTNVSEIAIGSDQAGNCIHFDGVIS